MPPISSIDNVLQTQPLPSSSPSSSKDIPIKYAQQPSVLPYHILLKIIQSNSNDLLKNPQMKTGERTAEVMAPDSRPYEVKIVEGGDHGFLPVGGGNGVELVPYGGKVLKPKGLVVGGPAGAISLPPHLDIFVQPSSVNGFTHNYRLSLPPLFFCSPPEKENELEHAFNTEQRQHQWVGLDQNTRIARFQFRPQGASGVQSDRVLRIELDSQNNVLKAEILNCQNNELIVSARSNISLPPHLVISVPASAISGFTNDYRLPLRPLVSLSPLEKWNELEHAFNTERLQNQWVGLDRNPPIASFRFWSQWASGEQPDRVLRMELDSLSNVLKAEIRDCQTSELIISASFEPDPDAPLLVWLPQHMALPSKVGEHALPPRIWLGTLSNELPSEQFAELCRGLDVTVLKMGDCQYSSILGGGILRYNYSSQPSINQTDPMSHDRAMSLEFGENGHLVRAVVYKRLHMNDQMKSTRFCEATFNPPMLCLHPDQYAWLQQAWQDERDDLPNWWNDSFMKLLTGHLADGSLPLNPYEGTASFEWKSTTSSNRPSEQRTVKIALQAGDQGGVILRKITVQRGVSSAKLENPAFVTLQTGVSSSNLSTAASSNSVSTTMRRGLSENSRNIDNGRTKQIRLNSPSGIDQARLRDEIDCLKDFLGGLTADEIKTLAQRFFRLQVREENIVNFQGLPSSKACIVNGANEDLSDGGGVNGDIQKAAGPNLLVWCQNPQNIMPVRLEGGRMVLCETGSARMSPSFNLSGVAGIIHAVAPKDGDRVTLCSSYQKSFEIVRMFQLEQVAMPALGTGINNYPREEGVRVMMEESIKELITNGQLTCLQLTAFDSKGRTDPNYTVMTHFWQITDQFLRQSAASNLMTWTLPVPRPNTVESSATSGGNMEELDESGQNSHAASSLRCAVSDYSSDNVAAAAFKQYLKNLFANTTAGGRALAQGNSSFSNEYNKTRYRIWGNDVDGFCQWLPNRLKQSEGLRRDDGQPISSGRALADLQDKDLWDGYVKLYISGSSYRSLSSLTHFYEFLTTGAIATASSAIATTSSAIATTSSAIATTSNPIDNVLLAKGKRVYLNESHKAWISKYGVAMQPLKSLSSGSYQSSVRRFLKELEDSGAIDDKNNQIRNSQGGAIRTLDGLIAANQVDAAAKGYLQRKRAISTVRTHIYDFCDFVLGRGDYTRAENWDN